MPLSGALWNPEAELELQTLTDVIAAIRAREQTPAPALSFRTQRPGWAPPLVLAVLREASEPMTVMEIVRAAKTQHGAVIGKETVRSIVQRGVDAKSGRIRRLVLGKYFKYEINWEVDGA